jgi:hypothetical protein
VRKLILWSIVVFLIFLAVQDPEATAQIFSNTIDLLGKVAGGVADVVQGLFDKR